MRPILPKAKDIRLFSERAICPCLLSHLQLSANHGQQRHQPNSYHSDGVGWTGYRTGRVITSNTL
ncbi:hypothetical protein SAMN05421690_11193 [Nitrosomonas sp. Nm51]|nr:hypothetical protein SAMN05421690_11193 [Nitrosomonas sp. Nm51]